MTTIHVLWGSHPAQYPIEVDGYCLDEPVEVFDATGNHHAVWSGDGITEAHAIAVGAVWDAESGGTPPFEPAPVEPPVEVVPVQPLAEVVAELAEIVDSLLLASLEGA